MYINLFIYYIHFLLDIYRFTSCKAFKKVMGEVTDLAGQHEVIAENLQSDVIKEITFLVKDFKEERKKVNIYASNCLVIGTRLAR